MKKIIIAVVLVFILIAGIVVYLSLNREKPCANCMKSKNSNLETKKPAIEITNEPTENSVPFPQEEDIVRSFFALIEEKRPSDAVSMMSETVTNNDPQKQAWAVQFNAISSIKVIKIEPSMPEVWTNSEHTYKLILDVKMNPDSANTPIPYYGWDSGENIRWVTIVKENNLWKIKGLATGP